MKPLRILLIGFNMPFFGTFRRSSQFGKHLVKRGHKVTLMVTSANRHAGSQVSTLWGMRLVETPDLTHGPLRSGWDPWNIANRLWWLRQESFDLVHAFECRPTVIYPALFATHGNVPLFIDWADWFGKGGSVEERPNPLLRAILRPVETYYEEHFRPAVSGNTVICSTLYQKALALGVPSQKLAQIPIGCDPDSLRPGDAIEARRRLSLPEAGFYIGYLGSAFPRDARFIADAFRTVLNSIPQARLIWFGARPASAVRELQGLPNTHIFGRFSQEQMADFLAAMDVGWVPLRDTPANQGRWPSKVNEYFCAGRPVVATDVGDIGRIVRDYTVGLTAPDQVESFARQTVALLLDIGQREAMGLAARRLAEGDLSWDRLTTQLDNFYQQTIPLL